MSDVGLVLRNARLDRNLALTDVSRATRINQTYLEALEDGDYSLLPGPAYVTGFLRNYARFLGLQPDDVVQDFYAARPVPQPGVKAATRVLESGYYRQTRSRLLWACGILILLLAGAYAVKQYNDTYAHPYSAPYLTPNNLGGSQTGVVSRPVVAKTFQVHLQAIAPVWVRVTADHQRVFQGILRPFMHHRVWMARQSLYVVTYDGARLRAAYNGGSMQRLASRPGLMVDLATGSGWTHAS